MSRSRIALTVLAACLALAAFARAFWPAPVPVDLAEIRRGPMEVTVSANGVTRIRDTYLVSAPISGTAARSPVEVGDEVVADETIVAVIEPAAPALLDARTRAQREAELAEAEAALVVARTAVSRAEADLEHSASNHARIEQLARQGTIPHRMLEDATLRLRTAEAALAAARSEYERQEAALQRARAQLAGPETLAGLTEPGECCVRLRAPASGVVLSVENMSARPVQAGAPLLLIGRPDDLEVEVELLSADAVRIAPGAEARITRWGGPDELRARVDRIEPAAQTRISALGIEERRVRVHLELLSPPEERPGLGENYRVFASIVEWRSDDVLQIPVGTLFRRGKDWAAFRVTPSGRAELVLLQIGRRTPLVAEVVAGLEEGDRVVLYPGDRIAEGTRVEGREEL